MSSVLANDALYGRRSQLLLSHPAGGIGLDLSDMHFTFKVEQSDTETPNSAVLRVYNLSQETVDRAKSFTRAILNAGYMGGAPYGKIFDGDIKQFGTGRIDATTTYLDIFAADGDTFYNWSIVASALASGLTPQQQLDQIMKDAGLPPPVTGRDGLIGGTLVRGKVKFGMFRDDMRKFVETQNSGLGPASWSIQNGQVQVLQVQDYLPGEAVVLNSNTGLIGVPEQTQDGIRITALLNPKIRVGSLLKIDNKSINQIKQTNPDVPVAFNSFTAMQFFANTAADGTYRVYVVEYEGDTRGQPWYSRIVGLLVSKDTDSVQAP